MLATLRLLLPMLLAIAAVVALDHAAARRGRQLPGLELGGAPGWQARRAVALGALAVALYLGVFAPVAAIGFEPAIDLDQVSVVHLFVLHAIFVVALILYFGAGLWRARGVGRAARWSEELGLETRAPAREIGIGLAAGALGWVAVIALLSVLAGVVVALGGERVLPSEPPPTIVFVAGLPWGLRLGLALSAGLVEEAFFRGLLQPRIGILASSVLFILAHVSYGQPFLLVGVTVLSFGLAALTRWRETIWPAVIAHTLFDAIQLLVIIPLALRVLETG
jgi:membrane protease YdiL (CAAX protease family)